jgi:hypothetical protein
MDSEEAEQANAIWHCLIKSWRRRKIAPRKHLLWIFGELPKVKTGATIAGHTPVACAEKLRPRQHEKKTA